MARERLKCDGCGTAERVLSIKIYITHRGIGTGVPTQHLCETCLLNMRDLAKIAYEIEGGPATLAATFSGDAGRLDRSRSRLYSSSLTAWLQSGRNGGG